MKIGVLFFGVLKDLAGRTGEIVDLPEGARVRDLLLHYARGTPRIGGDVAVGGDFRESGICRTRSRAA
jgi:molybdopterin converting factor small subunit